MDRRSLLPTHNAFLLSVITLAILLGLGYSNFQFAVNNPGGNDFLVHYIGTRSFLFDGLSPYSDTVAERIQVAAYGRPAGEGEHELRVAYPFYSTIVFSPFALVSAYPVARALWMTVLEVTLFLSVLLSLEITEWDPPLWLKVVYFLFALLWYHAVRGLINGNAVILISFFITLFLYAVKNGRERLAGMSLALSTIKPHVVLLLVIYVVIWGVSQRRWRLLLWFGGTLTVLIGGGMLFIPNWIFQNLWEIVRFPSYNPILSFGGVLGNWLPGIESQLRWGIGIVLGTLLLLEWWQARSKEFRHFYWVVCLTLVVSQWIGIPTDPGNFIILFPGLALVFAIWDKRWEQAGRYVVTMTLLLLFVGLWGLFLATLEQGYQPLQSPIMFIPLPAFVLLGLYWVRWWVLHPTRHVLNE